MRSARSKRMSRAPSSPTRALKISPGDLVVWNSYQVTGRISEGHLCAGTRVEAVKRWKEATSYAERYMAKPEEFPEGLQTGRIWGVWNEELLPVQWKRVEVNLRDAFRIRRIYRKLARRKGSGSLRRITVFVRYENVLRLLEFLGYRVE